MVCINMNSVIKCITSKYFDFSTRAPRKEYWLFTLFSIFGIIILTVFDLVSNTYDEESGLGVFSGIFLLLIFIPHLAVGVRRLHDTNRVGWWLLISLIPIVGTIWLVVLYCLKGNEDKNRYGENPIKTVIP